MSENKSIGALWLRDYTKDGEARKLLSGYVDWEGERLELVIYKNDYKKDAKHPDYQIYRGKRREEKQGTKEDVPF